MSAPLAFILLTLCAPATPQAADIKAMIAEVIRTGSVIVLGIDFARGEENPTGESASALRTIRAMLLEHPEWSFELQVHTDETGAPAGDQALSAARARVLDDQLEVLGIAAARLVPRGYGSARPLSDAVALEAGVARCRVELKKLHEE